MAVECRRFFGCYAQKQRSLREAEDGGNYEGLNASSFISESETLEDFGKALHLMRGDLEHLRNVFMAVETGDTSLLR